MRVMRVMRVVVVAVATLTIGAGATGCSSGSGRSTGSATSNRHHTTHAGQSDPSDTAPTSGGGPVDGVLGKSYEHGPAKIEVDGITSTDEAPPSGKARFDLTGLSLSSGKEPLVFNFVVACDGKPVGSLVTSGDEFASHDGHTIKLGPLAGGGATDTIIEVPAGCTKPTVTIDAKALGAVRYRVPASALRTG